MLMRKKFEITKLSGMSGMKMAIRYASCQMIFYLAWSIAHKSGLNSPQRDFFYLSCHMPDMPDVFKLFCVKSNVGGIYSSLQTTSGMSVYPPQRSEK